MLRISGGLRQAPKYRADSADFHGPGLHSCSPRLVIYRADSADAKPCSRNAATTFGHALTARLEQWLFQRAHATCMHVHSSSTVRSQFRFADAQRGRRTGGKTSLHVLLNGAPWCSGPNLNHASSLAIGRPAHSFLLLYRPISSRHALPTRNYRVIFGTDP